MTDFFLRIGLSNACFSLALAIVAMLAGARARRPHLAHLVWLLVFVKLLTPPIVTIPVVTIPRQPETAVEISDHSRLGPPLSNSRQLNIDAQPDASLSSKLGSAAWNHARVWLPPIWLLGSVVVFAFWMVRVCRFGRMLVTASELAPRQLQTAAAMIARRLKLNTIPTICTTSARLSPMVWWAGGKVRIVIPTTLLDQMDAHQSQYILAHELAHVRRRDHLVRWLEWLACVLFWWNPVVWWAQRNLRAMEEICCDELVMSCLNPKPRFYANSLLSAVEFLARPALRPPAMASEVDSGGFLERRFKMIVSETPKRSNSRWLQACVLLCAIVVLPLGIASAQDYEAVGKRLRAAVAAGELTGEHARAMMDALRRASTAKEDRGADRAKAYLTKVKKELAAAVEAGEISREDAAKKFEHAERALRERMAASRRGRDMHVEYEGFEQRIRVALAEGRITREEADAKYREFRKRMAQKDVDWEGIKRRIEGAVERGDITREEADAKYRELREQMVRKDVDWQGIRKRIEGAVERGEITREEADAKYRGIRERMARKDVDWEGIKRRVEGAVERGEITREEADAKYREIRERMARKDVDWEGIKRRVENAVERGEITREEADAKYKEIRERMAERRERGAKKDVH